MMQGCDEESRHGDGAGAVALRSVLVKAPREHRLYESCVFALREAFVASQIGAPSANVIRPEAGSIHSPRALLTSTCPSQRWASAFRSKCFDRSRPEGTGACEPWT